MFQKGVNYSRASRCYGAQIPKKIEGKLFGVNRLSESQTSFGHGRRPDFDFNFDIPITAKMLRTFALCQFFTFLASYRPLPGLSGHC